MKDRAMTKDDCLIIIYFDYDSNGEKFTYQPGYEHGGETLDQT